MPKGVYTGVVTTAVVAALGIAACVICSLATFTVPLVLGCFFYSGFLNFIGWKVWSKTPWADREKAANAAGISLGICILAGLAYLGVTKLHLSGGRTPIAGPGLG